ncbi:hydrolase [Flavobacterium quisquiliarum]|uniref:Hydrolase n=1 Tax=Flavobacterium quisquiliarum TaxID=1834436 RepID=A0ABV8W2Z6_9FLAO|nr:hydrolase [Flavobacterium quisquiliarum]MBW1654292.1 isochorismatase family protein [Flavobacterium quisquiliarum]NWL03335.1 hydrolase [Flavobacterium collinsii]
MLTQENTGLIIVDVQGKLARIVHESEKMISNLEKLIRGCQILSLPIIYLEQNPNGLGNTIPELKQLLGNQKAIEKYTFNAFENDEFKNAVLQTKRKQWLVCGIEAHICVYQTAVGLLTQNFEVEIVTDCTSSRSKNSIDLAFQKIQQKGVSLTNVEMCLYELVKDSRNENFKGILGLIK